MVLPSRKELGDLCPTVAEPFVGLIDDSVLFLSPRRLLDFWVEVIVPSLTALLPNPSLEVLGDYRPTFGAVLLHQVNDLHKHQQMMFFFSAPHFKCFQLKHPKMFYVISERSLFLLRCEDVERNEAPFQTFRKNLSPFKADFVNIRPGEHIQGSLNKEGNKPQTKDVSCHHVL